MRRQQIRFIADSDGLSMVTGSFGNEDNGAIQTKCLVLYQVSTKPSRKLNYQSERLNYHDCKTPLQPGEKRLILLGIFTCEPAGHFTDLCD